MVCKSNGGNKMSNIIIVVPAEDNKFKVLHNYIQHGVEYSNKEHAEKEAQALKKRLYGKAE